MHIRGLRPTILPILLAAALGCGQTPSDGNPDPGAGDADGGDGSIDGCPDDPLKQAPGLCGCGVPDTDQDNDTTPDCNDGCPTDSAKVAVGVCGCGVADTDSDADGTADCDDLCAGHDDRQDVNQNGVPDGCDAAIECTSPSDCDDGLACTDNQCTNNRCVTLPLSDCAWPAESGNDAVNLTSIGGNLIDNDFYANMSGAHWNPVYRQLWLVQNGSTSKIWVAVETTGGGFAIDEQSGERAEWEIPGDTEGITQADFNDRTTVFVTVEGNGSIRELDLSTYGTVVTLNDWNISAQVGNEGAEGIAFVPDAFLVEQGFVDADGNPYASQHGMGGLMLIGHQSGGYVYVYDLDRTSGGHTFIGRYDTSHAETAGLEFDRSTGDLYLWHDAGFDMLEISRLSSTNGKLDTKMVMTGPVTPILGGSNLEGIAIVPVEDCGPSGRRFFMTTDGGDLWSLLMYEQFPCW